MGDALKPATYKDDFIADLVRFVGSKQFQSDFEKFFLDHAMEFDYEPEHKLVYMTLYKEFAAKFEQYLEDFCKEKDITYAEYDNFGFQYTCFIVG